MVRLAPALVSLGLAVNVAYFTLPLLLALIFREIFDTLSGESRFGLNVWSVIAVWVAINSAHLIAVQSSAWVLLWRLGDRLKVLLQRNLLQHITKGRQTTTSLASGDQLNRFRDDVAAVIEPIAHACHVAGFAVSFVVSVVVLVTINAYVTVVALVPGFVIVLLAWWLGGYIERTRSVMRKATSRTTGFLGEILQGVQAIQVANTERPVIDRYRDLSNDRRKAVLREGLVAVLFRLLNETAVITTTTAVLLTTAQLMRDGTLSVGDFALFVTLVAGHNMAWQFIQVGELLATVRKARISFDRLFELMSGPPEELFRKEDRQPQGESRGVETTGLKSTPFRSLDAELLSYKYPGSDAGISDVSLRLDRGTFTVITGRIGAGKTTLLEALLGVSPLSSGVIRWNGERVEDPLTFLAPPRCAYTPQAPVLFSDTLRENILMGLPASASDVDRAVRLAVLEEDVRGLEKGIDTLVGPRGVRLSGGQAQRTAAARMFVRGPELLVFDDLSSALDVDTEKLLWREAVRDAGRDSAGRIAQARRPAPRRPDHRLKGRARGGGRDSGRADGVQ